MAIQLRVFLRKFCVWQFLSRGHPLDRNCLRVYSNCRESSSRQFSLTWIWPWRISVRQYSQRLANGSILQETVDSFKMAKREWSRIGIWEMIVEYEGRPSLWDVCSPEYRDRNKQTEAWKTLAVGLKLDRDIGEVQRKIHNLRNLFCQELKKSSETKSGQATAQTCKSRWPYFDSLKFIQGAVATRKSTGNLVCTDLITYILLECS